MSVIDRRLRALEATARPPKRQPVVVGIHFPDDDSEPPAELIEEAKRQAAAAGQTVVFVCPTEAGEWAIVDHSHQAGEIAELAGYGPGQLRSMLLSKINEAA